MDRDIELKGCLGSHGGRDIEMEIVIPAWNEERVVPRALREIGNAIHQAHARVGVILVDNGSTDETPELARYAGATVITEPHKGVSYARQTGLEASTAPVILGTDGDLCGVPADWIDAHLRHYEDPKVVGVAGHVVHDFVHPLYHIYRAAASLLRRAKALPTHNYSGGNFSYRRSDALAVGYAPGRDMGEDFAMGLGLQRRGTVDVDRSAENTVVVDGRRFNTAFRVLKMCALKVQLLLEGKLYDLSKRLSFEDIREKSPSTTYAHHSYLRHS